MKILFCSLGMAEARERLAALLPEHTIDACAPHDVAAHLDGVAVLTPFMTRIDAAILEAGQFGLIQQIGVGLETVDIATATRLGVWVARVPSQGVGNAESVAEHAIMLLLALSRRLPAAQATLAARRAWFAPTGQALLGKEACIVGLGGIGTQLALRLRGFGMRLTAVRARPEQGAPAEAGISQVYGSSELHRALGSADYVVLCARYDQHNHHMIDAAALAAMQPGAFLVNVARGGLVDPDALLAALQSGHLAGAGLDVFWQEPVDPTHPLFGMEHVIATPHHAGVTDLFHVGVTRAMAENIRRYARGEAPLHAANQPTWQR
jgi:phosphoglycerate dehydrogenase-like enzyme